MYDTQKRVALAKERIVESRRRQARRSIRSLSALCALLFLSLLGTVGTVQSQPMDAAGMYGAILLHEGVGGYVLEAVISFTAAVVLTAFFGRRKEISVQEGPECRPDRCSAVYILLHIWRYPLQSALVRYDDHCFLFFYPGTCLCQKAEGNCK